MKKLLTTALLLAVGIILCVGCGTTGSTGGQEAASAPVSAEQSTPEQVALFTGDGGKGISLAILAPKAQGLDDAQTYIPALVQGEFVSNFTGYSAISVLDRERLDEQYAEILSGYYDEDTEAGNDLGHLVPTDYIMGGSILKTASGYALQMSVTKTSDKTTLCSYSGTCTFEELDNLTGVRRTSLDLLAKMGVRLTARAQGELSGAAAVHEVQGQTALAQGVTAQRGGTVVEALSYYFQAASYDASLIEAASRVNILSANITSGNMGEDIRNDIEWRDQWRARLAEAERVYADYMKQQPRYSLVYDVNLKHGETNYSNNTVPISGVTLDLVPDAAWFNAAGSVVRVINVVREGLLATKQAGKWGLDWPRNTVGNSPFGGRDQRFEVTVELMNAEGKTIGSERITMSSGYDLEWADGTLRRFIPRLRGVQHLGFNRVNAYDITDSLTVRIAGIDGVDAETAAKTKGINILREAEYARLPDVGAGVDSRALFRLMQELEITYRSQAYFLVYTRDGSKVTPTVPAGWAITGYKGAGGRLVIPANIFGCSLTAIGNVAFAEQVSYGTSWQIKGKGLTSVVIRDGITAIGVHAFAHNNLTSVVIPNSVTEIYGSAFAVNNLSSIVIPNGVTKIYGDTFFGNPLTSITIPGGVDLDRDAFGSFGLSIGFVSFYNKNGKKAGTYTRPDAKSKKWTYRP
ncbi:MAG: leucine-rich repeat domain-containing protein [Treponema sp.]|jgi:hypothetical protein|nr:leucine-rich repeat domain-containing protein [Treponema sp.]